MKYRHTQAHTYTHTHSGVFSEWLGAERWGRAGGAVWMGEVHVCLLTRASKTKLKRSVCVQNKSTEGVLVNLPFVTFGIFQVSSAFCCLLEGEESKLQAIFL